MEEANGVYPWNINYQSIGLSLDFEIVDSLKCEVSIPTLVLLAFDTLVYLPPWEDNPMDCNPRVITDQAKERWVWKCIAL